jgi:shikimate kinase
LSDSRRWRRSYNGKTLPDFNLRHYRGVSLLEILSVHELGLRLAESDIINTNHVSKSDNIFLVGPMGVGKTTIGKRLAKRLDKTFFDSDKEIEKRTGASISLIFDVEGEQGFREREARIIDELTSEHGVVIATGGGAILAEVTRDRLAERGTVVYLSASPELLMKRTEYDQNRPLLNTTDRLGRIKTILNERTPLYTKIADISITVDKQSIRRIVDEITDYMTKL